MKQEKTLYCFKAPQPETPAHCLSRPVRGVAAGVLFTFGTAVASGVLHEYQCEPSPGANRTPACGWPARHDPEHAEQGGNYSLSSSTAPVRIATPYAPMVSTATGATMPSSGDVLGVILRSTARST